METVKCKALQPFSHFVSGYGIVHGNPDDANPDKRARDRARNPEVPVISIAAMAEDGLIQPPKDFVDPAADEADEAPTA